VLGLVLLQCDSLLHQIVLLDLIVIQGMVLA
jgi:hypothetical protein